MCVFARVALYSSAVGGNYILDATNLLEFVPNGYSWLVTLLSIWWALGYSIAGLLAWAFMSNFSCPADTTSSICLRSENMGWRYLHFTGGGLVLALSILRILVVHMVQTPKWLISQNRDDEVIQFLTFLATKYDRRFDLTLEDLRQEGNVRDTEKSVWSYTRIKKHFLGLFQTRKLAWSYTVILLNWLVIGTVSPLYYVFLPYYLAYRGQGGGPSSNYITWRNYAIDQVSGLLGPILAAILVESKFFGRRGTLALGAFITMVLQFGYTQIRSPAQNLGVSAAISAAS